MGVSQREGNYLKNISIMKSKYLTGEVFTKYGASWRDVDYQISIYGPLPAREGVNMQMHCCGKSPQQQSGQAQSKVGRKSKAKQQFRKAKQKTLQKKTKRKAKQKAAKSSKKQSKAKVSSKSRKKKEKNNAKQQSAKNKPMQENQNKIGKTEQKTKIKAKQSEKQRRKTCKRIKMTSSGRDSCSVTECKFWKEIEQNF